MKRVLIKTLTLLYTVFITTLPVRHHMHETIRRAPLTMTTLFTLGQNFANITDYNKFNMIFRKLG